MNKFFYTAAVVTMTLAVLFSTVETSMANPQNFLPLPEAIDKCLPALGIDIYEGCYVATSLREVNELDHLIPVTGFAESRLSLFDTVVTSLRGINDFQARFFITSLRSINDPRFP